MDDTCSSRVDVSDVPLSGVIVFEVVSDGKTSTRGKLLHYREEQTWQGCHQGRPVSRDTWG